MEKKKKYNEKQITKRFLVSPDGIQFLSNNIQDITKGSTHNFKNIENEVVNLIDYYTTWAKKFPIKRVDRCNKYEFMKYLEEWLEKNDMYDVFNFLYEDNEI